jgi:O-antigen/teichoic acid export membrane protein
VYTLLGALLWFYLASKVSPFEYGSINYEISIATILTAFGVMGFDTTLTTYVAKGVSRMLPESASLILLSGIILSFFMGIFLHSWSLVSLVLGMMFFTFVTARLLGLLMFKEFMIILSIQRILTLITVPLLFEIAGVDGAVLGFALSHLVLCKGFFTSLTHIRRFSLTSIVPIKKYFFHAYALGIARVIPYFSDKLLILPLFGLATLGYYQFGVHILTVTAIIPVILYNYLLPKVSSGSANNLLRTALLGIAAASVLSIGLFLSIPSIVLNFFPNFASAIPSTQLILLAGIPFSVNSIVSSAFMGNEKSHHVVTSAILFLGIQYSLIILLGNQFGLFGLSFSMVLASITQCIYLLLALRRCLW